MSKKLLAIVQNGRFIIEEPATEYPEGTQLRLVVEDDINDEERERLDSALSRAIAQADAGQLTSKDKFYSELSTRKSTPPPL